MKAERLKMEELFSTHESLLGCLFKPALDFELLKDILHPLPNDSHEITCFLKKDPMNVG